MWALLLNRYVIGGGVIAALVLGGYLYVGHLKHRAEKAEARVEVLTAELAIAKKTLAILKESEHAQEIINNLGDDELAEYFHTGLLRPPKAGHGGPPLDDPPLLTSVVPDKNDKTGVPGFWMDRQDMNKEAGFREKVRIIKREWKPEK